MTNDLKDKNQDFDEKIDSESDCVDESVKEEKDEETNAEKDAEESAEFANPNAEEKPSEDAEFEKRFARLQADFSNYKKRVEKEKQDIFKSASSRIITSILPVLDDLDRALAHSDDTAKAGLSSGLALIAKSLNEILAKEGLEYIDVKDAEFNPNIHHAVMMEEVEGVESGKVIQEVQKGYKVNGKVVRPSMVKVSQ